MLSSAFQQLGKTVTLNTNAVVSTNQSAIVLMTDFALTQAPQSLRMINNGTADVWVYITPAAAVAAFPTAGTTTAGTPQPGFRLKPGVVEVFGLNVLAANPNNVQPPVAGFWVNTISSVASQPIDISPGEGM
jgi:hypothetical protein